MVSELKPEQLTLLHRFLDHYNMSKTRIHKEYSDGVLVARLLKKLYPRLVELHNYPVRSSVRRKLENWYTLNYKVLRRLNLMQSPQNLEAMASSTPGFVERLLWRIMQKEGKTIQPRIEETQQEQPTLDASIPQDQKNVSKIEVKSVATEPLQSCSQYCTERARKVQFNDEPIHIGDTKQQVGSRVMYSYVRPSASAESVNTVPFALYQLTLQDSNAKDEVIETLTQKHVHLKNLLRLKNEQLDVLTKQVSRNNKAKSSKADK